jgi:uncharacterized LabA/DUF88 family protein
VADRASGRYDRKSGDGGVAKLSELRDTRVAVLIDAENIAARHIDEILDKASLEGRATVKRIYGDFSKVSKSSQACGWNGVVSEYALTQMQQIQNSSGKNSSDSALIIDAMDLLYSETIDVMCIVTNDSDFTRLAMRIAEAGLVVIGMGTQVSSKSFTNACSKFYTLDEGESSDESAGPATEAAPAKSKAKRAAKISEKTPASYTAAAGSGTSSSAAQAKKHDIKAQAVPKKVINTIITAIEDANLIGDDWVNIARIGIMLYRRFPEFDPSLWNRPKQLSMFLKSLDDYFQVEQGETIGKSTGSYIRIRT